MKIWNGFDKLFNNLRQNDLIITMITVKQAEIILKLKTECAIKMFFESLTKETFSRCQVQRLEQQSAVRKFDKIHN